MKTYLANHGRSILRAVKRVLPAPITLLLKRLYYQHLLPLSFRDLSSDERKLLKAYNVTTLPPADLRFRVHGTADVASFLAVGKTNYESICQAIALAGVKPNDVRTVLDFGCGSGRTLLWWLGAPTAPALYATDIDEKAVAWVREHLKINADQNSAEPPLPYADDFFDVLYSISVFTHLSEPLHQMWLRELRRIIRPGGLVLASVHSDLAIAALSDAERQDLFNKGFLFYREAAYEHIYPDFYQTAFQSREYIEKHWGELFELVGRISMGHQDLVVMRKAI